MCNSQSRLILKILAGLFLVLPGLIGGCGGNEATPGGTPPEEGGSVALGPLQVGVAATAGFRTLVLNSPGSSRIAFTALHGARIVPLQEMGYGRIALDGSVGFLDCQVWVMDLDGTGAIRLTTGTEKHHSPA